MTENVVIRLRRVRITAERTLNDGKTQTPDITLDTVGASSGVGSGLSNSTGRNSLWCHVTLTADVGFRNTRNQVSTDTKIANLDLTPCVHEDVCGLDVAVDDVVFVLQRLESHGCRQSDLA